MKRLIPILSLATATTIVPFIVSCEKPATYINIDKPGDYILTTNEFNVSEGQLNKFKLLMSNWNVEEWGQPGFLSEYWYIQPTGDHVPTIDVDHTYIFCNGTKLSQTTSWDVQGDYLIDNNVIWLAKPLNFTDTLAIQITFNADGSALKLSFGFGT